MLPRGIISKAEHSRIEKKNSDTKKNETVMFPSRKYNDILIYLILILQVAKYIDTSRHQF